MTVENTTTIDGLDITLPRDTDLRVEGDNHLRQFKIIDKTMFPGFGGDGFNKPITANENELNFLQNIASNIEDQLQDLRNGEVGIGMIQFYTGLIANIPVRFFLCNGLNGTPDLTDNFVLGAASEASINAQGGFTDDVIVSHNHNADHDHPISSTNNDTGHIHQSPVHGNQFTNTGPHPRTTKTLAIFKGTVLPNSIHNHQVTMPVESISTTDSGISPIGTNIPKFYKTAYIMRVS